MIYLGIHEDSNDPERVFWNGEYVFSLWEDLIKQRQWVRGYFSVNQPFEVSMLKELYPDIKLEKTSVSSSEINRQIKIVLETLPELLI